jgi:hypothetical protein
MGERVPAGIRYSVKRGAECRLVISADRSPTPGESIRTYRYVPDCQRRHRRPGPRAAAGRARRDRAGDEPGPAVRVGRPATAPVSFSSMPCPRTPSTCSRRSSGRNGSPASRSLPQLSPSSVDTCRSRRGSPARNCTVAVTVNRALGGFGACVIAGAAAGSATPGHPRRTWWPRRWCWPRTVRGRRGSAGRCRCWGRAGRDVTIRCAFAKPGRYRRLGGYGVAADQASHRVVTS